jgi:hypothetical protein
LKRQIDAELQNWKLLSSVQYVILLKRRQISPLIPLEGAMKAREELHEHFMVIHDVPTALLPLGWLESKAGSYLKH